MPAPFALLKGPAGHETGGLGHDKTSHRCALVANQAANSRVWEIRNPGSNLIIPTRLTIQWLATGNHTATIEDSLDVYKVTGFTVLDTTNVVTPCATVLCPGVAATRCIAPPRGVRIT